jgi:hypothetical protein
VATIELPEGWVGVAEPLHALMAEIERKEHADRTTPPDLATVWAQVSDVIRGTVRLCIAGARAPQARAPSDNSGLVGTRPT